MDERWMRRALALAERGRFTVSPNPLVGCVLVRDGEVVGEGWHERPGGPHAEIAALAAANHAAGNAAGASGATAYVTLEPCAHTGRTGPCAGALIAAGVARVVAAVADPNPPAAGGATALRAAGIDVDLGLCEPEARRQNEVFFHAIATGRPFVVLKLATSLDGRIAAEDGTSQWLTGPEARARAHRLRAEADAVVVGSGTVLADDPRLTVRLPGYDGPQPLRVILDRRHRVPPKSGFLHLDEPDPKAVLAALWDRGVRSVLVEGGAIVARAFVAAGFADKVVAHVAPVLLDGARTLVEAPRLRLAEVEQVGNDAVLTMYAQET